MVFAVLALLLQHSPTSMVVGPLFRANLISVSANSAIAPFTSIDGTRPTFARPATVASNLTTADNETFVTPSGEGHLDLDEVSFDGKAYDKAGMVAVSLSDREDSQPFPAVRIPEPLPAKPIKVYNAEKPRMSHSWFALTLMQHGAATFDAYTTREAIGRGAVEEDPLMRPFAHSGAIYAAIQVGPLVLDYVARRMQHSEYGVVRRMWFVPQSVSTAGFILSGAHNLGVRGHA